MFSQSLPAKPQMILAHDLQSARLVRQHRALSVNELPHAMRRCLAGTKRCPARWCGAGHQWTKGGCARGPPFDYKL